MSRLKVVLGVVAAVTAAALPSAAGADRGTEHRVTARAAANCGVYALTPGTAYSGGIPASAWGNAQYWCTAGSGTLTVQLKRDVPVLSDPVVAQWRYNVPARGTWSGVYTTPRINCSAYGRGAKFYVYATHSRGGSHKGTALRACG
jgi:type II secretory pathway pseudopilin PulG